MSAASVGAWGHLLITECLLDGLLLQDFLSYIDPAICLTDIKIRHSNMCLEWTRLSLCTCMPPVQ